MTLLSQGLEKKQKCVKCGSFDNRVVTYDSAWGEEYDIVCNKCGSTDFND